jgi:hypothetical protein
MNKTFKHITLNYLLITATSAAHPRDTGSRLLPAVMALGLIVAAASITVDGISMKQLFGISEIGINNGGGIVQTAFAMPDRDDGGGDDDSGGGDDG